MQLYWPFLKFCVVEDLVAVWLGTGFCSRIAVVISFDVMQGEGLGSTQVQP